MGKSEHAYTKMRKVSESGMSMIEVLVALGIVGFIIAALTAFMVSQQKESRALAEKLSVMDLQQLLISSLADGAVCTFLMTDDTQASNRSSRTINASSLANQKITLNKIPLRGQASSPSVVELDMPVSALSPQLKAKSISIENLQGSGDFYMADILVSFTSNGPRVLRPIAVKTILRTDPASPANAKVIVGCKNNVSGSGGRAWSATAGRSLNTSYVNDAMGDIEVNVQIYSGPSGRRCSASITVGLERTSLASLSDS